MVFIILGGVDHGAGLNTDLLEQVPYFLVDVLLMEVKYTRGREKREKEKVMVLRMFTGRYKGEQDGRVEGDSRCR